MFPRVKRSYSNAFDEISVKFYDKNQSIEIDRTKCIGCGICIKACPKQVIYSKSIEGIIRITTEDLIPEIPNPLDCSFCGTCAFVCPTSAIFLKKNNKYVKRKDIGIIAKNVVPQLQYDCAELANNELKAKTFIDGEIEINWDKCISCMSCVEVCPTGSFSKRESPSDKKEKRSKPKFNNDKCIKCGACERACSRKAINLKVDDIRFSGKFKEIFWIPLVERLKGLI